MFAAKADKQHKSLSAVQMFQKLCCPLKSIIYDSALSALPQFYLESHFLGLPQLLKGNGKTRRAGLLEHTDTESTIHFPSPHLAVKYDKKHHFDTIAQSVRQ